MLSAAIKHARSACGFASARRFIFSSVSAVAKPRAALPTARLVLIAMALLVAGGGCASYAVPGGRADFKTMGISQEQRDVDTDGSIRQALTKKPLAQFPTGIAVARVQASGYSSPTARGWGHGNYSVVTTRDIEKPEQIKRLAKLPMIEGVAPMSRILLPESLQSDCELRQAAAQLHADMLLIYTIDTQFTEEDKLKPMSVITLGLSPNRQVRLVSTASAVLMDTRNGYVYGVAEATSQESRLTNGWQSGVAVDETRRATESAAFEKLVGEFETTWRGVVQRYSTSARGDG
jgi:hypothetical protein